MRWNPERSTGQAVIRNLIRERPVAILDLETSAAGSESDQIIETSFLSSCREPNRINCW